MSKIVVEDLMKLSLVIFAVISSLIIGCGGAGPEGPEGPVDMPAPTASGTVAPPDAAPVLTNDAGAAPDVAPTLDAGPTYYCVVVTAMVTTVGPCEMGASQPCGPSGLSSPTAYGPTYTNSSCAGGPAGVVSTNLGGPCALILRVDAGGLVCTGVVGTSL
jgi:hypothetical protein